MCPAPIKPLIDITVVESIDIRVGMIERAEEVEGSRKLIKLIVDFGDTKRQILSGMKQERANLQELVGLQALFVVNLPARLMAGESSEGMLFDIGYPDGITAVLAIPEHPVPNGTRAG